MPSQRPLYHRFAWPFDLVVPDASLRRVQTTSSALGLATPCAPPSRARSCPAVCCCSTDRLFAIAALAPHARR